MRVQNSVYNWIEASITQCERWDLGSENGSCFWNYFHRHLWNSKVQIIYCLYTLPQLSFLSFFFTSFFFSSPIFWFLKSVEFLLENTSCTEKTQIFKQAVCNHCPAFLARVAWLAFWHTWRSSAILLMLCGGGGSMCIKYQRTILQSFVTMKINMNWEFQFLFTRTPALTICMQVVSNITKKC